MNVLDKVELLIACRGPEIVTVNYQCLFLFVTRFVDDCHAALFSKRRIRKDHFIFAVLRSECVLNLNRYRRVGIATDPVQEHIHGAEPCHAVHQFHTLELFWNDR